MKESNQCTYVVHDLNRKLTIKTSKEAIVYREGVYVKTDPIEQNGIIEIKEYRLLEAEVIEHCKTVSAQPTPTPFNKDPLALFLVGASFILLIIFGSFLILTKRELQRERSKK